MTPKLLPTLHHNSRRVLAYALYSNLVSYETGKYDVSRWWNRRGGMAGWADADGQMRMRMKLFGIDWLLWTGMNEECRWC